MNCNTGLSKIVIAGMRYSFLLLMLSALLAQGCSFTQKVKTGFQAYEVKQYAVAANLFTEEYGTARSQEDKARLAFMAGESFAQLNHQPKAAEWYFKAHQDGYGPESLERYAVSLTRQEKYQEAGGIYDELIKASPGNAGYRAALTLCRQAQEWADHPNPAYHIEAATFNSPAADYAAQPIGPGKVLFTSDRGSRHTTDTYLWTGRSFSDMYVWNKVSNAVEEFDDKLNSPDNDGAAVLSPDKKMLVFTRCYPDKSYDGWCKLMASYKRGNQWSPPEPFPFQQEKVNYGQPAFAANGNTLFFSSDAPGGQGGHDLYFIQWDGSGQWTAPQNLGAGINTAGDELYPTVYEDTLFYSSDRLAGLGGLDIFKTWLDAKGNWVPPVNLRAPVNSGGDDFGYVIDTFALRSPAVRATGYFTSSRGGVTTGDDIYSFSIKADLPSDTLPATDTVAEHIPEVHYQLYIAIRVMEPLYQVKDDPNSPRTGTHPLPNGPIIITEGITDRRLVTDELGQILIQLEWNKNYVFSARYRDHLSATFNLNTGEIEKNPEKPITTINQTFILEPIIRNKEIILENIFYDYDQWAIREDAKPSLNHLSAILKANPSIRIQLTSHTDCRGTEEYNLQLSQKRAQAAVDYLMSTGIPARRMEAVGMGESSPAVRCECERCTEEQHQTNRRTTFKIID